MHTPTFSASLGADGLETVFLFFTHHCLFFFFPRMESRDAKSKAVLCGRGSACVDQNKQSPKKKRRVICEVTLLTWPPSEKAVVGGERAFRACVVVVVGVEERRR